MPLLLGVVATISVLGLWQQLQVQEQLHIQQLVQQEANALELELDKELSNRILALQHMANRWRASQGTPRALWEADVADYIHHSYGFQAIEWVDSSFHVRWVVPIQGNEMVHNLNLGQESRRQITLRVARDLRQTVLTKTISLVQGGKGFLACVPLFVEMDQGAPETERFDGFIVGVFRFQALFDNILKVSSRYRVQIYDQSGLIYSQGETSPSALSKMGMVRVYGADWKVQVFPTAALIAEGRSLLPTFILWGGLAGAWTLSLALYLAQRSALHARQARKINQQLRDEIIHRQQVESNSRETEERLQFALEASGEGWWDWDITRGKVNRSPQYLRLLGYKPDEFPDVVDSWENSLHPDDVSSMWERLTAHLQDDSVPYACDYRLRTKSGDWQWISDYGKVVKRDAANKPLRMVGTFKDIRDRKQAESLLRRYERIVSATPDLVSLIDLNYRYQVVNQTYLTWYQKSTEEIIGHSVSDLLGKEFFETMAKPSLDRSLAGEPRQIVEAWLNYPDGQRRYVRAIYTPYVELDGTISGVVLNVHDLTELKQAELENQSLRDRLQFLLAASPVVIYSCKPKGDFGCTFISENVSALFRYTPADFLAEPNFWAKRLHPDDAPRVFAGLLPLFEQGHHIHEYRFRHGDGHYCWVQDELRLVQDAEGEPLELVGCLAIIDDRKQAEVQLQSLSDRLNLAVQSAKIGIWDLDLVNDRLIWDDQMHELYGIPPTDFGNTYEAWEARVHPDDLLTCRMGYQQALAGEKAFEQAFRVVLPNGTVRYIEAHAMVQCDPEGQPLRMIGVNRDVTDRKQAEHTLEEQAAILRIFYESSPLMLGVVELSETDILHVSHNSATLEFFGLTTAELTGKWASELGVPLEYRQLWLTHYRRSQQQQQPVWFEYEDIRGTQTYWLSVMVSFLGMAESQRPQFSYIVRDVSESKRLEAECQRSEAEYQRAERISQELKLLETILEIILAGYWDWDLISNQEYLSPGFKRMFGYEDHELPNAPESWQQLIFPEDFSLLLDCFERHVQSHGVIPYSSEVRYRHKDGSIVWVICSGQVIEWDLEGRPRRMIGCHINISDLKRQELRLQQAMESAEAANLAKSIFLANMSHELRTPLNVILGFAQVMAHDTSLTSNQREDLQTIRRSGDHLLSLINDVLDLSKIEAGHCTLEAIGFDLIALLQTLHSMMTERATAKYLQFEFDIAPAVPQFVIADEKKLRQILLNLLSNAIKFTDRGSVMLRVNVSEFAATHPSLSLSAHRPFLLRFEVIDTGIGIAASDQSRIFDAFVQAEAGKRSVNGTGLGLTISRKLLELMHGEISVSSVPNIGSTFAFTIPVHSTDQVHIEAEHPDRVVIGLLPGQPRWRILVVDDQRENRLVLARLLALLGLETREATSGQEAIRIWQEWQPDLIWMDIRMPGMDGYEATQQIRAMEQGQLSIIIALTAQASQSDRDLALASGCNDYISKPFREEIFFRKLQEYLGLKYLYAEPEPSSKSDLGALSDSHKKMSGLLNATMLASLSPEWLKSLENAAICGYDIAILKLAAQLPPEFAALANQLINFAEKYQFEQILQLIDDVNASSIT
jgi:PAS domain S-box-containing protein